MATYETLRMPNNLDIQGNLTVRGTLPTTPRSSLQQEDLAEYPIPLERFRVWDAYGTLLGSAGTDDLGIAGGTFGANAPYLTAGDCKNTTATRYGRVTAEIPPEYVAGQTVKVRVSGGMLTTVASSAATVDVEVYLSGRDSTIDGSDLVTTAAQSINSLTFADKDFDLDPSSLNPGDTLDIRLTLACTDSATGTAVTPAVGAVELLCDIKG